MRIALDFERRNGLSAGLSRKSAKARASYMAAHATEKSEADRTWRKLLDSAVAELSKRRERTPVDHWSELERGRHFCDSFVCRSPRTNLLFIGVLTHGG